MELQHNLLRHVKQNVYEKQVIGVPITSQDYRYWITNSAQTYLSDHQYQILPPPSKTRRSRVNSATNKVVKFRQNLHIFAQGIREHVRLGPKLSETVKGKLRLGARILHVGGLHKIFINNFNIIDGEKLFTASQCYLSTTAGPIAGLLFVSSERVGFCSDRSIKIYSPPNEKLIKQHYKVIIPLAKIKRAVESENVKNPRQKYVEIVTEDNFEFWFMGFLNHQRTLRHLQNAINPSGLK
ncbi:GEM-like protein 7 [Salvia hispanica]|uniref:GEM-like protein 7 n=1 Tax=Salvia hispanica TaxID=49212 RepID=UPI002009507D|nr:GEM-like protein 7 [Salvia hispanica]